MTTTPPGPAAPAAASVLVDRIGTLVTNDPALGTGPLGEITDAALVAEGGRVAWAGPRAQAPAADTRVDAAGRCVVPGFVDSHSHIVFAGDRSREFEARMSGRPYEAGGIRTTVAAVRAADDTALAATAAGLLREARAQGTTTLEVKSGYGLSVADEERCLRVAASLTEETTFLGAHVVPPEYAEDPAGYVDLVTGPMLAACAPHARWIDVFCERGAFDADQARAVLRAGRERGLGLRVHGNQLGPGPGVRVAVEEGAASVDHCTHLTREDVAALADAAAGGPGTVATLLPGVDFSTRQPYPDARALLDAGAVVALAGDCNPGTCFSTSMAFCVALAVREMRMTPAEALWAATAGGARALRRTDVGHLGVGARADLVLLAAPNPVYLAYRPGVPLVAAVWKDGERVAGRP
ncbi:imidazolonepropionase [Streptomonospora nanhaiensis]|uniref:Imidazolonepropionase n=1 Tax=Streptomonospora nanhaiensis TaxID=1323731 RepID=A0A853BXL2_9ACTN|nr:imidazolonepropionase [Streptomonospora nanhaiensis]MBV2365660.1 imidazolonepropionase [Streptomonospora nanhaiensis]MBX9388114.1 imidazolonepropionase [Streptomonospora nanhaiensis]NYI98902.1 imidazolonepropionase [Streptomonospora nanhaiensis]